MIARGIHFTMLQHVIAAIWLIHAGQTQSATDPKPLPSWTVNAWYHNIYGIGICLVGDFEKTRPTPKQLRALDSLVATLAARYDIPPANIIAHKQVPWGEIHYDADSLTVDFLPGKHEQTSCPGKNLSIDALRRRVAPPRR